MSDKPAAAQYSEVITEIRTYQLKVGRREEFLQCFHTKVAPLFRSVGIAFVGPFCDLEKSDTIVWLRTFPSLSHREQMLKAFHECDEWESLRVVTGDMIEGISQTIVLLPSGMLSGPVSAER
ncbi:MAG TPA: NIPSNAP family protein [Candidatus Binatia bacterium]|nr:NIPSNAP family protein [Candidatus Binatia bacterium]